MIDEHKRTSVIIMGLVQEGKDAESVRKTKSRNKKEKRKYKKKMKEKAAVPLTEKR